MSQPTCMDVKEQADGIVIITPHALPPGHFPAFKNEAEQWLKRDAHPHTAVILDLTSVNTCSDVLVSMLLVIRHYADRESRPLRLVMSKGSTLYNALSTNLHFGFSIDETLEDAIARVTTPSSVTTPADAVSLSRWSVTHP